MKKITAEEALDDLEELGKAQALIFDPYEDGYPTGEESISSHYRYEDYYNGVKNFIEQHLPPTFDEVVKAWQDATPRYNKWDNRCNFSVKQRDKDTVDIEIDWYGLDGLKFTKDRFCIRANRSIIFKPIRKSEMFSIKQFNAIHLTIRYLESQKEKESE